MEMCVLTVLEEKDPDVSGLVSSRASPWLAGGWLCPVSWCGPPSGNVCVLISSCDKDTSHIGLGPVLITSFYLSHLFQALSPNTVPF